MSSRELLKIEPFGEALTASGHPSEMLRFGYRVAGTETLLAFVEVPLSVVQESIPREVSARLTQNGTIIASLDVDTPGGWTDIKEISLVHLVEEVIEPHHLSMEEIRAPELDALLRTLEISIQLVRTTISTLNANGEPTIPALT